MKCPHMKFPLKHWTRCFGGMVLSYPFDPISIF